MVTAQRQLNSDLAPVVTSGSPVYASLPLRGQHSLVAPVLTLEEGICRDFAIDSYRSMQHLAGKGIKDQKNNARRFRSHKGRYVV